MKARILRNMQRRVARDDIPYSVYPSFPVLLRLLGYPTSMLLQVSCSLNLYPAFRIAVLIYQ